MMPRAAGDGTDGISVSIGWVTLNLPPGTYVLVCHLPAGTQRLAAEVGKVADAPLCSVRSGLPNSDEEVG